MILFLQLTIKYNKMNGMLLTESFIFFRKKHFLSIMKTIPSIFVFNLLIWLSSCCTVYNGYGRYTLNSNCERVVIATDTFLLTKRLTQNEFVIDGHTVGRGIYRKTRPWLYVHELDLAGNKIDVTFDSGSKPLYPLYTGSSASIFDVYSRAWDISKSTCAVFDDDYWLVVHRWAANGVYFDLQQRQNNDDTDWNLVQADIFVNSNGTITNVSQIDTDISLTAFDANAKIATVQFTENP